MNDILRIALQRAFLGRAILIFTDGKVVADVDVGVDVDVDGVQRWSMQGGDPVVT